MLTLSPSATQAGTISSTIDYRQRGWTVVESADAVSLETDGHVGVIEIVGDLARDVHEYLRVNRLIGPVIHIPGNEFRELHLVAGLAKAPMALKWITELGAIVHRDGATVALPTTEPPTVAAHWVGAPDGPLPAAVAIAAAIRAVRARAKESADHPLPAAS